jgi:hypothetical protein
VKRVVDNGPGLCVQHAAIKGVRRIGRRVSIDGEELREWQRSLSEEEHMVRHRLADVRAAAAADHLERAVVLSEPLVEPQRGIGEHAARQQV